MTSSIRKLAVAGLMTMVCAIANPAAAQDSGFYLGGGVGRAKTDIDMTGIAGTVDESDTGWKLFGGYQINRYFGVEAGYADLGSSTFSGTLTTAVPPFPAGTAVGGDIEAEAWFVSAVGTLPITDRFSALGKLGVAFGKTEFSVSAGGLAGRVTDDSTEVTYGLGLKFDVTRNFSLRGEWDRFRVGGDTTGGKGDVDLFTLNAIFRF